MYLNRSCDNYPEPPIRIRYLTREDTDWVTAKGKALNVKDMTTNHINNCVKLMQKSIDKPEEWKVYSILKDELKIR